MESVQIPEGHEIREFWTTSFPEKFISLKGKVDFDRKWWQVWRPKWIYAYTQIVAVESSEDQAND
jgi:hypothetical protein